jgi:hypothetical protein
VFGCVGWFDTSIPKWIWYVANGDILYYAKRGLVVYLAMVGKASYWSQMALGGLRYIAISVFYYRCTGNNLVDNSDYRQPLVINDLTHSLGRCFVYQYNVD